MAVIESPFNFNAVVRFPELPPAGNENISDSLIMDHQSEKNLEVNVGFVMCRCCFLYLRLSQVERHLRTETHGRNLRGDGRVFNFNWQGVNS